MSPWVTFVLANLGIIPFLSFIILFVFSLEAFFLLLHITREFYSIKLICTNLYAVFSHVRKAYTANQNCVQLFHM